MKKEINVHSENLVKWAQDKERVIVLSADLGSSCEVKSFSREYPDRYYSMGIAEQNMVSWAAGMAREGYYPMLHTFSVFMYRRALDQLEMSIAYSNLPVAIIGFLPGMMTPGGPSHQAINDVAVMRSIPNMRIYDTGDATEVEMVLDEAYAHNGPVYIRMLRGEIPRLFTERKWGEYQGIRVLQEGSDVLVFSSGIMTSRLIEKFIELKKKGMSIKHIHISRIKPLDIEEILTCFIGIKYGVLTVENHLIVGGLGTSIAEVMAEYNINLRLFRMGIPDMYLRGGSFDYLCELSQLTNDDIEKTINKIVPGWGKNES